MLSLTKERLRASNEPPNARFTGSLLKQEPKSSDNPYLNATGNLQLLPMVEDPSDRAKQDLPSWSPIPPVSVSRPAAH